MNSSELIAKIESVTAEQVLVNPLDNPFALASDLVAVSESDLSNAKSSLINLIKNSDGKKYSSQSEMHRLVFGSKQLRELTDVEREILAVVES